MNIKSFTFNPFQENTYVVYDESKECVIIDPGCYNAQEQEELTSFIDEKALTPIKLINTHCHIDHILGNQLINLWGNGLSGSFLDLYRQGKFPIDKLVTTSFKLNDINDACNKLDSGQIAGRAIIKY